MSRNSDREIDAGSKWLEIGRQVRLAFGPAFAPARGKARMICRRPWSRTSSESSGNVSRKLTSTTKSRPVFRPLAAHRSAPSRNFLIEQNDWLPPVNPNDRETLLDYLVKIQSP